MRKLYTIATGLTISLLLIYLMHYQAQKVHQKVHQRKLQACTEKLEKIRVDAAKFSSVDLYPFQDHQWEYDWTSNFEGGIAAFSKTQQGHKKRGFVDLNNNILLEYHAPVKVDSFPAFSGFENGYTRIFVYEHDSVPWGFLLPYGNPVPRVDGTIDCTGKVTLERERIPMP